MEYYKGANEKDIPFNGGSYVTKHGRGHEEYNFDPVDLEGNFYCLGFVETKSTSSTKRNDSHIEKIAGCASMKNEASVDDVLVVWCATTDLNETSVVGWYKHATVYRQYEIHRFENGYEQAYNVVARKENCVLLPKSDRHEYIWKVPVARQKTYGFGQSLVWYATEDKAQQYLVGVLGNIERYAGENCIDKSAFNA